MVPPNGIVSQVMVFSTSLATTSTSATGVDAARRVAGADSAYASVDLVVVVELDFGGGVRLRQVQNTGLVRGGRSAEHDLEGPCGGGPQLVQRLIGPEIKNEPTA
ncbi:hypothetical protein GCM10023080_067150 [Streptomyces pseudoechinosporeus]